MGAPSQLPLHSPQLLASAGPPIAQTGPGGVGAAYCQQRLGLPAHRAQLPPAPRLLGGAAWIPGRLQVRMRGNGGQKGQGALVLPLGLVWSHASSHRAGGQSTLDPGSQALHKSLFPFAPSVPHLK